MADVPTPLRAASPTLRGEPDSVEPSRRQLTAARRVAEARATIPDFWAAADLDLEGVAGEPVDVVVHAAAQALRALPQVNAAFRDARFERYPNVHVAVAVPTDDGPVHPTLFDADTKDVAQLAQERERLAARARDGSITAPEISGATFTVVDLGAHGLDEGAAVIVGAQAGVLAVGRAAPRPVVRDGALVARRTARLTLTCDARVLQPEDAGAFLAAVAQAVSG